MDADVYQWSKHDMLLSAFCFERKAGFQAPSNEQELACCRPMGIHEKKMEVLKHQQMRFCTFHRFYGRPTMADADARAFELSQPHPNTSDVWVCLKIGESRGAPFLDGCPRSTNFTFIGSRPTFRFQCSPLRNVSQDRRNDTQ